MSKIKIILMSLAMMIMMISNAFAGNAPIPWSTEFRDIPFSSRTDRSGQERWVYYKQDGFIAKDCWVQNHKYDWYYCGEDGFLLKNTWIHDSSDGKYYYLGVDMVMLHDTTTPDGYTVGSDGAWIRDGQVVVENVEKTE